MTFRDGERALAESCQGPEQDETLFPETAAEPGLFGLCPPPGGGGDKPTGHAPGFSLPTMVALH